MKKSCQEERLSFKFKIFHCTVRMVCICNLFNGAILKITFLDFFHHLLLTFSVFVAGLRL